MREDYAGTLEVIYDLYFEKIYKFFYYKFISKDLAEELTADTFLIFAEQAARKNIEKPENYLFGVAKNVFTKQLKRKYAEEPLTYLHDVDFHSHVDEFLHEVSEPVTKEDLLLKLVEMIPPRQKDILIMRLIEKKSLKEICEEIQKDMNYVKTTQKRAIKSIKKALACTPKAT